MRGLRCHSRVTALDAGALGPEPRLCIPAIHEPIAVGVEQEHTIDQEFTIHELVAIGVEQEHIVGVNTSDQMVFDIGQTHASTNGAAHVIKNVGVDLIVMYIGGSSIEFGWWQYH